MSINTTRVNQTAMMPDTTPPIPTEPHTFIMIRRRWPFEPIDTTAPMPPPKRFHGGEGKARTNTQPTNQPFIIPRAPEADGSHGREELQFDMDGEEFKELIMGWETIAARTSRTVVSNSI